MTTVKGLKIIYWEPRGIRAVRGTRRQLREIGRRIIRAIDPDDHHPDDQPPARRHACTGTLMTGILSHGAPPLLDDRP